MQSREVTIGTRFEAGATCFAYSIRDDLRTRRPVLGVHVNPLFPHACYEVVEIDGDAACIECVSGAPDDEIIGEGLLKGRRGLSGPAWMPASLLESPADEWAGARTTCPAEGDQAFQVGHLVELWPGRVEPSGFFLTGRSADGAHEWGEILVGKLTSPERACEEMEIGCSPEPWDADANFVLVRLYSDRPEAREGRVYEVHVTAMAQRLTRDEFEAGRKAGWSGNSEVVRRAFSRGGAHE
jgi:hypothetical protein